MFQYLTSAIVLVEYHGKDQNEKQEGSEHDIDPHGRSLDGILLQGIGSRRSTTQMSILLVAKLNPDVRCVVVSVFS